MDSPTVLVLHGRDRPPAMREIEERARVRYSTPHLLPERLPGAQALFLWEAPPVPADVLAAAADLRWVHTSRSAADPALLACAARGVAVSTSRGTFDDPVAEYVLALALAFTKDLRATLTRRSGKRLPTERLAGTSALVVGTGSIARAVARKLRANGVTVAAAGRVARTDPELGEVTAFADLGTALPRHDWVILASPVTPETTGLIDARALHAMRAGARLITVSRSALIVLPDLVRALDAGRIAGAALDVFSDEPLPDTSRLWDLPNVVVSPHVSGDVRGWKEELVRLFGANLTRFAAGQPLLNALG